MFYIKLKGEDQHERVIRVPEEGLSIGRSYKCDIVLESAGISRTHARIACDQGHCFVEDTGSRNGLLVNGEGAQYHWLRDGDVIDLPHNRITFHSKKTEAGVGRGKGDGVSEQLQHSIQALKERWKSRARSAPVHPYAFASLFFVLLAAWHWAFASGAVIMGFVAVREINLRGVHRGKPVALAALLGGIAIGTTNLFLAHGGMDMFFHPDSKQQRCRENLEIIYRGIQSYRYEHGGDYPVNLSILYPDYVPLSEYLACPGSGSETPGAGYEYVAGENANINSDAVLVIDDGPDNHGRRGALALLDDGDIIRLSQREYEYLRIQADWLE